MIRQSGCALLLLFLAACGGGGDKDDTVSNFRQTLKSSAADEPVAAIAAFDKALPEKLKAITVPEFDFADEVLVNYCEAGQQAGLVSFSEILDQVIDGLDNALACEPICEGEACTEFSAIASEATVLSENLRPLSDDIERTSSIALNINDLDEFAFKLSALKVRTTEAMNALLMDRNGETEGADWASAVENLYATVEGVNALQQNGQLINWGTPGAISESVLSGLYSLENTLIGLAEIANSRTPASDEVYGEQLAGAFADVSQAVFSLGVLNEHQETRRKHFSAQTCLTETSASIGLNTEFLETSVDAVQAVCRETGSCMITVFDGSEAPAIDEGLLARNTVLAAILPDRLAPFGVCSTD